MVHTFCEKGYHKCVINWTQDLTPYLCGSYPPQRAHLPSSPGMVGQATGPCWLGWLLQNNAYKPKMTPNASAPKELMEGIYCGCKTGCTKRTCKCKKLGLSCSIVWLDCKGNCYNGYKVDVAGGYDWVVNNRTLIWISIVPQLCTLTAFAHYVWQYQML